MSAKQLVSQLFTLDNRIHDDTCVFFFGIVLAYIPYPLEYNHGVVFFNMSFWVRFNSKNPSKRGLFDQKMGFYSRKSPKTGLLKRGEVIFKSGAVLERIR